MRGMGTFCAQALKLHWENPVALLKSPASLVVREVSRHKL